MLTNWCRILIAASIFAIIPLLATPVPAEDQPVVPTIMLEGKMVCVGDSITAGEGVKPGEGYVDLIKAKVAADHLKLEVVKQGRSGWSTQSYVDNKEKMAKAMPADATIVTIFLGTNDAHETGTPDDITKKTGQNLEKLIDLYQQKLPNAKIVILAPTRIYPAILTKRLKDAHYGDNSVADLKLMTPAFAEIARRRGLLFIDLSEVPSAPENSIDGVHPDPAGHKEICDTVWKSLTGGKPTTQP